MLYFKDFIQNYISDNRNQLLLPENKISESKSSLRKNITLDECKSILGRKYKICIHRMLPICSYILSHHSASYIQLSTYYNYNMYSKHLFNLFNNIPLYNTFKNELEQTENARAMNNQRALKDLQKLGIIKCVSDFKHFNSTNKNNNIAYAYVFDIESINSLLNINSVYFKYHYNSINTNNYSISNNNYSNNYSNSLFNIPLYNTFENKKHSDLYNKYLPLLQYELDRQTTQNEFRYHLKQDGSRPYAYFCSSENRHSDERKEILNSYFGKGNWQEWDRSASIYNLTYSYNTKKYIPNNIDLHAVINNAEFSSKEERDAFKLINMTKYFSDARKLKKFISSMVEIKEKYDNNEPLKKKEVTFYKNNIERANAMCKLSNANNAQELVKWYKQKRDEIVKTLGGKKLSKDAVFIMEGVVNLATLNDLNNLGYKTVSVYDGFYTECFDNDLIEDIYRKNVNKYIIGE